MATHFINPLDNPVLRGYERLSPTLSIDVVVGYDDEGWPVWKTFRVGDIVVSHSGKLYRVQGFTYENHVLVTQHGLDRDPRIASVEFEAEGLDHLPKEEWLSHKDGLVSF